LKLYCSFHWLKIHFNQLPQSNAFNNIIILMFPIFNCQLGSWEHAMTQDNTAIEKKMIVDGMKTTTPSLDESTG